MPRPLSVNGEIHIPAAEIKLSFARSAGPGGQNVNKVNTKAILRWNVRQTTHLPAPVKARFLEQHQGRINEGGEIVVASDRFREQPRNIADCYQRLRQLILAVAVAPVKRLPTRPTRAAMHKRLQRKNQVSQKKRQRRQQWEREA